MPTDKSDLYRAIFVMDAYNRGNNRGIEVLDNFLGNVAVGAVFRDDPAARDQHQDHFPVGS